MTTAAIYVRISQDREGAGLGIARQEKDCRVLADRLGHTVTAVHVDNDISAYSGKRRPAYEDLLNDISAGSVEAVLSWHTDRLHRSPIELERYISICEPRQVPTITATAGPLDLATPSGRMIARMLGATARYEAEHKSERQRRKHLELAQAGKPCGGIRAFGYEKDRLTVVPHEAAVFVEVAARLLAGESLRAVAADLNSRGIGTVTGVPWNPSVIRSMAGRARYAGLREHKGATYPATWPALISLSEHLALKALFSDPSRDSGGRGRVHLLAGIMRCHDCQLPVTIHVGGAHRPAQSRTAYRCEGCGQSAAQPGCDQKVISALVRRLRDPRVGSALGNTGSVTATDEQIVSDGLAELARIGRDLADRPGVSPAVVQAMAGKVQERVDAAQARLATAARRTARAPQVEILDEEGFRELPLATRRAVVEGHTERIEVWRPTQPGRFFDPARIRIRWRR